MNGRKNRTPVSLGRETFATLAVSTALLTLTACGGGNPDNESDSLRTVPEVGAALAGDLKANSDVAQTTAGVPVAVTILQNDTYTSGSQFQLLGQPANGSAVLLDSGEIEYTANTDFEGTDIIEYQLVDAEGTVSTGKVYIAVACAECTLNAGTDLVDANGFPYCENISDDDGDGYGWENGTSCVIETGSASNDPLAAVADVVEIKAGDVKTITPLRNDSIADRQTVDFAIDSLPGAGRIEAAEAGVIVYAAPQDYSGEDSIVYSITDLDGNTSVANIDINVICDSCVDYQAVRLSWAANPDDEDVDGYKVLFGSDENPLTSTVISQITVADGDSPEAVFSLNDDLNLGSNDAGCFMIQAYRGAEVSEVSQAACFSRGS